MLSFDIHRGTDSTEELDTRQEAGGGPARMVRPINAHRGLSPLCLQYPRSIRDTQYMQYCLYTEHLFKTIYSAKVYVFQNSFLYEEVEIGKQS